jgi:hypothetical protein
MKTIKKNHRLKCHVAGTKFLQDARHWALPLAGAMLLAVAALAQGAEQAPTAKAAKPPAKQARPTIDAVIETKALEILKAASSRLAAAKAMKFTAVISQEAPSRYGPALVYTTKSEVTMRRPDKLKVVTLGDGPASEFYFDGKVMMALAPAENLVAVADAPPTIDDTLQYAFHLAEIYFPFTDLIVTDPYTGMANGMQLAFYIGQSKVVGGTTTDMVAYASDDVFAQIWIGAEDKLPRKVRAVYRKDPLLHRHEMDISNWQLDPAVTEGDFVSAKAKDAKQIKFAHPSTKLAPGVKPQALRKPAPAQPAKSAPVGTK